MNAIYDQEENISDHLKYKLKDMNNTEESEGPFVVNTAAVAI